MKKLLAIALMAAVAGSVSAAYVAPLWESTASPWGGIDDVTQWGGTYPSGSTTGLLSSVTTAAWVGGSVLQDIAVRDESGVSVSFVGDTALRGGSSGSGITTIYEIDDPDGDYSTVNLNADTAITLWSQWGEKMELSVLSGRVETPLLNLLSGGNGTINMRNGEMNVGSCTTSDAQFNMLAGGTGNITVDAVGDNAFNVNFETGTQATFTLGSKFGGSTGGVWEWVIGNGNISIDGVTNTDLSNYNITYVGDAGTIAMIPEPATLGLLGFVGGGLLWFRKRFTI